MSMKPHEIYGTQMSEVKLRLLSAERMTAAPSPLTGLAALDSEFCFLQIRKIIELITFSGMVREQARYRKLRAAERKRDTDRADATADWKASEILSRLVKLSPCVLPIPLGEHYLTEHGVVHFEREELTVTHARLIELYKNCSRFIHVANPLVEEFGVQIEEQRQKYIRAPATVKDGLAFLRKLLWLHAVVQLEWTDMDDPRSIDNPSSAWIVDFGAPDAQTVNMTLGTASDTDPS